MIVDVHCHLAFSGWKLEHGMERFSFEKTGAEGHPGFDAYASPRLMRNIPFQIIRWKLGIDATLTAGPALDARLEQIYAEHFGPVSGVEAIVLLAFDEYRYAGGIARGPTHSYRRLGTDTYTSNTLSRGYCRRNPDRFLFGASIHPYRHDALKALEEVVRAGAVLIKWLPVHQNIEAADPRTIAFVRRAAELEIPLLIHYGGEMSTANQHPEQMNPRPLLTVLRDWPKSWAVPTLIIAHAATPSMPWQHGGHFRTLMDALDGEFRHHPIYADISAMTNRPYWLWSLARRRRWRGVQSKLIFGSDFPIPPLALPGMWKSADSLDSSRSENFNGHSTASWVGTALAVSRAYGISEAVFHRGGEVLRQRIEAWRIAQER